MYIVETHAKHSANMRTLSDLVGKVIISLVPAIHPTELQKLKLHGVEDGGIWVEHPEYTSKLLEKAGLNPADQKLIFLPFQQVTLMLQTATPAQTHDLWAAK